MAITIHLTRDNKDKGIEYKKAPLGFSWTTLFFGGLPHLYRKEFGMAILLILCGVAINALSVFIIYILVESLQGYAMWLAQLFSWACWIIIATKVNNTYNRSLAEKDWFIDWKKTLETNPKVNRDELRTKLAYLGYLFYRD